MSVVYATPEYISTLETSTPISRQRPRRLRAPGLPGQQPPAARGDQRLPQRAPAGDRRPQRLHRVQAARQRLRDGRPRHALPRARSPTPAAARSARATTAAATAASGRWSRRTHPRSRGWFEGLGVDEVDVIRVYRTFHAAREPFQAESEGSAVRRAEGRAVGLRPGGARWPLRARPGRSAPRPSPGSRARARCRCASATARSRTSSSRSTSRRASSRRSCAAGRFTEAPDITARICGICPVAYMTSAFNAMEDALGVEVDERHPRPAPADVLRRVDRDPRAARLPAARARLPRLRVGLGDGRATTARWSRAA